MKNQEDRRNENHGSAEQSPDQEIEGNDGKGAKNRGHHLGGELPVVENLLKYHSYERIEIEEQKAKSRTDLPLGDELGHLNIENAIIGNEIGVIYEVQPNAKGQRQKNKDNPTFPNFRKRGKYRGFGLFHPCLPSSPSSCSHT
jgi:hypothetical protein